MLVEELMTVAPATCTPEDSMNRAARIFWEHDCGCVPVVDAEQHVLGMLTDRDVCIAAYTQGRRLEEMVVRSAMSPVVHTCLDTDSVEQAERIMRTNRVRRLPVLDDRRQLVGVLSLHDIAQAAAKNRHRRHAAVTDIEVAETLSTIAAPRRGTLAGTGT